MALFHLLLIPRLLDIYYAHPAKKIPCGFIGPEKYKKAFEEFIQKYSFLGLSSISVSEKNRPQKEPREYFMYSETKVFSTLYKQIKSSLQKSRPLHVGSKLFDELNLKWEWARVENIPIYTFSKGDIQYINEFVKRLIDISGALLLMIILSPLFLIIALAVKLDSPGPVIYKQKRCGRSGKQFIFYKFRSMVSSKDTDSKRELEFKKYLEVRTSKGKILSSKDITTVGSILRKASIDELPQLWNVLRGDMSLVGPRPPIPYEVKYYKDWHKDRLLVKQGLTGLWQIYGRGEMPSDKSIFLDMIYVINQSLILDLNLIFQTIPAVILGKGAY
jgi:lipopolysaccharide/colanic/teichoic acid biosynthesis glycosyltransferase